MIIFFLSVMGFFFNLYEQCLQYSSSESTSPVRDFLILLIDFYKDLVALFLKKSTLLTNLTILPDLLD